MREDAVECYMDKAYGGLYIKTNSASLKLQRDRKDVQRFILLRVATLYSHRLQQKLTRAVIPLALFYRPCICIPLFCTSNGENQ